jgi:hypothetical protein
MTARLMADHARVTIYNQVVTDHWLLLCLGSVVVLRGAKRSLIWPQSAPFLSFPHE